VAEAEVGDEDEAHMTEEILTDRAIIENEITADTVGADNLTGNKVAVTNSKVKHQPTDNNNNPTDSHKRRVTDSNIKSSIYSLNR